jgi:hypothetical protein
MDQRPIHRGTNYQDESFILNHWRTYHHRAQDRLDPFHLPIGGSVLVARLVALRFQSTKAQPFLQDRAAGRTAQTVGFQ